MPRTTRARVLAISVIALAGVVAFFLFRPDKLFADDPVDESLDEAFAAATTVAPEPPPSSVASTTSELTTIPTTVPLTTAPPTTTAQTTTTSAGPVAISRGAMYGIDHQASGTATVYRQGDEHVLRFEDDTDIQNGPDLHVWLLADDSYEGGVPADYIYLGLLKGNVGGQNYPLPGDYDPEVHRFVLIWCDRFSVPFTGAPLEEV